MVIRTEQMVQMEKYAERAFESEMANHLREFAPARTQSMGDESLKTMVRAGLSKARGHGFTVRGSVRLYLDLMCVFGSDFDTDPQYPWAAEVHNESGTEMDRADRLYRSSIAAIDEIAGPTGELMVLGLCRIAETPLYDFCPEDQNSIPQALCQAYPEKARHSGPEGMRALFGEAADRARALDLTGPAGIALLSLMMFTAGHGVIEDSIYRQKIEIAVTGATTVDMRISRLHSCARSLIDLILEDIAGKKAARSNSAV